MENESEDFWIQLLKRYLVDAPSVVIRGLPSLQEQKTMAEEEKKRLEAQRQSLGMEGLEKKSKQLKDAMAGNEVG